MHFTQKDRPGLLQIAAGATGSLGWATDARAFGVMRDDGTMTAVAVFQRFIGHTAEIHFATLGNAKVGAETFTTLVQVAFHPRALNLDRLWAPIAEDNIKAQVAALKAGFSFEYRNRAGLHDGKDAIVLSMWRSGTLQAAARHQKTDFDSEV